MSDSTEAKIQRRERYIEDCRREAKLLSPEGQRTMQTVIDSQIGGIQTGYQAACLPIRNAAW